MSVKIVWLTKIIVDIQTSPQSRVAEEITSQLGESVWYKRCIKCHRLF